MEQVPNKEIPHWLDTLLGNSFSVTILKLVLGTLLVPKVTGSVVCVWHQVADHFWHRWLTTIRHGHKPTNLSSSAAKSYFKDQSISMIGFQVDSACSTWSHPCNTLLGGDPFACSNSCDARHRRK